ncbi:hypothetical protein [Streptosporangium sp. NPDC051022]|uniref:hypothetical protein n=1 Tax=Streptosporangium sp. NPDC051022 TaxID=3155752 RepID=UPI003449CCEA
MARPGERPFRGERTGQAAWSGGILSGTYGSQAHGGGVPATAERALADLRRELHALGTETEEHDVFWMRSGDPTLSLAPGLVVRVDAKWFRWLGDVHRWRRHTTGDPAGAARLIHRIHEIRRVDPPEGVPVP